MRLASFIAVLPILLAASAVPLASDDAQGEPSLLVSGWGYSRARKTTTSSNRVSISFTAKNQGKEKIDNVEIAVCLKGAMGDEVFKPISLRVSSLAPGASQPLSATQDFVPDFGSYEIRAKYAAGGKQETANYIGSSDIAQPELSSDQLAKGASQVIVLGAECSYSEPRQAVYQYRIRVKNAGDRTATGLTATVTYADDKGRTVHTYSGKLGEGKLGGSETRIFEFRAYRVPNHANFRVTVKCDEIPIEEQLSGGEFTGAKEIQVSRFRFKRTGDKGEDLAVSAEALNGLSGDVSGLQVTLTFLFKDPKDPKAAPSVAAKHTATVDGTMKSGEIRKFEFTVRKMPRFTQFDLATEVGGKAPEEDKRPSAGKAPGDGSSKSEKAAGKDGFQVVLERVTPQEGGSVQVEGMGRNGTDQRVEGVSVALVFYDAEGKEIARSDFKFGAGFEPGETQNFAKLVNGAKGFAQCVPEFTFVRKPPANKAEGTTPQDGNRQEKPQEREAKMERTGDP